MAKTGSDFNDLTVKEKEMLEKGTKEQKEELSRYGWQSVRSLKSPDHKFTASQIFDTNQSRIVIDYEADNGDNEHLMSDGEIQEVQTMYSPGVVGRRQKDIHNQMI